MTTILFTFLVAFGLSLCLTPLAKIFGFRAGAVDLPGERKAHTEPTPRCGGIAIVLSFFIALAAARFAGTEVSKLVVVTPQFLGFTGGALVVFAIGLFDDFRRIGARTKLLFHILAATIAFWGGVKIQYIGFLETGVAGDILSYLSTVFWFVLFINAVNLIDGLDGLAAGVCLFTSIITVVLTVIHNDLLNALMFGALGGALVGFLRYNFNPASIFLGDGGSYFLGYAMAGLAILGLVKSQTLTMMLIPLIAMGVPVFDAILSPLRRFAIGKRMFLADAGHIHHRLVGLGISRRTTVLIIYSVSVALCITALIVVHLRSEQTAMFLALLGVALVVLIKKIGYFEYFALDKILGWLRDITDVMGISRDRRSFLSHQIDIGRSRDFDQLWLNLCGALDKIRFDRCELRLNGSIFCMEGRQAGEWLWLRESFQKSDGTDTSGLLRISIPLIDHEARTMGMMEIVKDLQVEPITQHTIRRVEHLRRALVAALDRLLQSGNGRAE